MRARNLLIAVASLACSWASVGCKSGGDTEASAGADAAPASTGAAAKAPAVATGTAVSPPPATNVEPHPPASPTPAQGHAPGGAATGGSTASDAGAAADAGKPDTAADAGTLSTRLKACSEKCQGVLQACLTPTIPKDGGLPQLKDPAACQSAFDTCRTACTQ